MRRRLLAPLLAIALCAVSCSGPNLQTARDVLAELPPIVVSLHLAPAVEARVRGALTQTTNAVEVLIEHRTHSNLDAALSVIEQLERDGAFRTGRADVDARIAGIIGIVRVVLSREQVSAPAGMARPSAARDEVVTVEVTDAQARDLKAQLKALKKLTR